MSDSAIVRCPRCRKRRRYAILYMRNNICSSCHYQFDISELVQVQDPQPAIYEPRKNNKSGGALVRL